MLLLFISMETGLSFYKKKIKERLRTHLQEKGENN